MPSEAVLTPEKRSLVGYSLSLFTQSSYAIFCRMSRVFFRFSGRLGFRAYGIARKRRIPAALMVKSGENAFRQTGGEAAEAVHERRIQSGSDRSGEGTAIAKGSVGMVPVHSDPWRRQRCRMEPERVQQPGDLRRRKKQPRH